MNTKYETIKFFAEKWELNPRTVRKMCADGKIDGAIKLGRDWMIPIDTSRPVDGRITSGEYVNWRKNENSSNE